MDKSFRILILAQDKIKAEELELDSTSGGTSGPIFFQCRPLSLVRLTRRVWEWDADEIYSWFLV